MARSDFKTIALFLSSLFLSTSINARHLVSPTPALGFNTWDITGCNATFPNAKHLMVTADQFISTGIAQAGYKYINLDDCWMKIQKDSKGRQVPDPLKFPPSQPGLTDGIEIVANYLTNLKLQMGIYTAMGQKTCAGHAGSCGSEVLDTTEYNAWNMSYLKIDACGGCGDPLIDTAKLRKGFPNKLVQVHPSTDVVAVSANPNKYGNARRIGHDMMPTWFSMLSLVDASSGLHKFAHNDSGLGGFYNDLDMLAIGNPGDFFSSTTSDIDPTARNRILAHFTMWIILKAPILLSTPLEDLSKDIINILTNTEVLNIHQDSWGKQAKRVASTAPKNTSKNSNDPLQAPFDAQVALLPCLSDRTDVNYERQQWRFNATDGTLWTSSNHGKSRWCLGPSTVSWTKPLNILPCDDLKYRYNSKVDDCTFPKPCNFVASWDIQNKTCLSNVPWPNVPCSNDNENILGGIVGEGCSIKLQCQTNEIITKIDFADYGLPSIDSQNTCTYKSNNTCTSTKTTMEKIQKLCIGQNSCVLEASNLISNGIDPCEGIHKRLAVRASGCQSNPPLPPTFRPVVISGNKKNKGGGDGTNSILGWGSYMQGQFMSGPLPHAVYLSAAGGTPTGSFSFDQHESDSGTSLRPSFGTIIDDNHIGTRISKNATEYCATAVRGGNVEIWAVELSKHRIGVTVLNRSPNLETINIDWLKHLNVSDTVKMNVRNVWKKKDIGTFHNVYETKVPGHGVTLLIFTPVAENILKELKDAKDTDDNMNNMNNMGNTDNTDNMDTDDTTDTTDNTDNMDTATDKWDLTIAEDGTFTLTSSISLAGVAKTCPSYTTSTDTKTKISLCDSKCYQHSPNVTITQNNTSAGELGTYTDHNIHYLPVATTNFPAVTVVVRIYSNGIVAHLQLQFHESISTNFIATLSGDTTTWTLGDSMSKPRILDVPIDNNVQSMYSIRKAGIFDPFTFGTSAYVSAFFDDATRRGLIIGYLEHDLWKTGIKYYAGRYDSKSFEAIAGINGILDTRDYSMPHGTIPNCTTSPWLSIALHTDWRDGMNQYARMLKGGNGKLAPVPTKSNLPDSVFANNIAGFNTWGLHENPNDMGRHGNITNLLAASNVLSTLKSHGFGNAPNSQWIDQDAMADLTSSDFDTLMSNLHEKSQYEGSYMCPFVHYGGNMTTDTVTCNNQTWPLKEVLLKDTTGNPLLTLTGTLTKSNIYAYDSSHPYSNCHVIETVESILSRGSKTNQAKAIGHSQLLKVDFIDFAAMEAIHYNATLAPTGMAAYNLALQQVWNAVNGRMLIDLSMSLALPHQYAHSRRIGCDQMYGGVEYSMNQQTGGFWLNELYRWLDPDLIALSGIDVDIIPNAPDKLLAMDRRSRVAKAVVVGGLFLNGDDLSNATNVKLVQQYLGNEKVNSMWNRTKVGVAESRFRTSNSSEGWWIFSAHVFARKTSSNSGDIALFNYEPIKNTFSIDMREIGSTTIDEVVLKCMEIWDNTVLEIQKGNVQTFDVPARSSMLIECEWN